MTVPRSRLSALPGERLAGIGHNQGPPLEAGRTWRLQCWKRARAALLPRLPVEVVRRRVARARELGLAYPDYAAILLGAGRDIVGFLFTCDAIGMRLQRGEAVTLPPDRAARLRAIAGAERVLLTDPGTDPARVAEVLAAGPELAFAGFGPMPHEGAAPRVGGDALRAVLGPLGLPPRATVMVGTRAVERDWAEAARTARFLSAEAYFRPHNS